jgi:hypothetical protein
MTSWVFIGRLGRATPGREALIGSKANQPLAFALYGNIREEGREEMVQDIQATHTVETVVDAVTFPWGVPEVVNHRDPVLTAFFPVDCFTVSI